MRPFDPSAGDRGSPDRALGPRRDEIGRASGLVRPLLEGTEEQAPIDRSTIERPGSPGPGRRAEVDEPEPLTQKMRHLPTAMREARGDEAAAEHVLLARARAGDASAFDDLVRLHFSRVYTLLFRMLRNHEDAEDLAQESFVRAYRALPSYRAEAAFSTWVGRIAVHLAVEHHRKRAHAGRFEVVAQEEQAGSARWAEPGTDSGRAELIAALSRALDRLPPRLRAAIVLRTLEEREYDDIAELLGVRPATARTHVMQARKLLVRWLAPWMDPDDAGGGAR
jgi:RNA polymerase sigma-70 factor (ECF subfamily)